MKKILFLCLVFLTSSCATTGPVPETAVIPTMTAEHITPTETPTPMPTLTPTPLPTLTFTPVPTITPLPTQYPGRQLNCPGSVALMYHQIYSTADKNTDFVENINDIGSLTTVLSYLVKIGYYFPTPEEFALDVKSRVCRQKYAIIIIDDSWNDPEKMEVTRVLKMLGGGTGKPGAPKVWFAVITRMMVPWMENGQETDQWIHLKEMMVDDLVYTISHSQTHPLPEDPYNPQSKVNNKTYKKLTSELSPSRREIMYFLEKDPYFFVYPGGYVADEVINGVSQAGYVGAFSVWEGGLDKARPYLLPRINGGSRCGSQGTDNSACVIGKIEKYTK